MQKLLSTVEHALVVGQRQNTFARYQQQKEKTQEPAVIAPTVQRLESLPVLKIPAQTSRSTSIGPSRNFATTLKRRIFPV